MSNQADNFDLDDILDNAIKEFDDEEVRVTHKSTNQSSSTSSSSNNNSSNLYSSTFLPSLNENSPFDFKNFLQQPDSNLSKEEMKESEAYLQKLLQEQFSKVSASGNPLDDAEIQKAFENMSEEEKKMMEQFASHMENYFEQMQSSASESSTTATSSSSQNEPKSDKMQSLDETIEQTLNMLEQNAKRAGSVDPKELLDNMGEDDNLKKLMKMIEGMNINSEGTETGAEQGGEGNDEQMYSILEKIMQTLMSPDVLQAPMKQLKEKYPAWLKANESKISKEELERIQKQYHFTCKIVEVYETQPFPQSLPVLIDLMKEMQSLGQPPEEIVNSLNIEGAQLPNLPDFSNDKNCSIM